MRARVLLTGVMLLASCGHAERVADPIDGVPLSRQKTVSRTQFGFRWPLSPGIGTLACSDGNVILFRAGGVTYVVQGTRAGAADISSLRIPEPSMPPSNPVSRVKQDVRMQAFAAMERCRSSDRADICPRAVEERYGLSADEARLIEAEGQERRWPPLARGLMSLDPLVRAGLALCTRGV